MIQYELTGSSGTGYSYWSSFVKCPRKASFDERLKAGNVGQNYGANGLTEGTIGHAFAELYYAGKTFEPEDVIFDAPLPAECLTEMTRVWKQYRIKHPADEFGTVISVEEKLDGPALEQCMGIAPYTMKADLVVDLTSTAEIARLIHLRPELYGIEPGRYLVDHKFLKARMPNADAKYLGSFQFTTYMMGWNACKPLQKVDGTIVNMVIKTKEIKTFSVLVPAPTDDQMVAARTFLQYGFELKIRRPDLAIPLEDNCFGYSVCKYLANGMCDRGATEKLIRIGG